MGKIENKINDNRIVYIDPNDAEGHINGAPITPDYTNFCLWCNLVVERSSRLKNQAGGTNSDETVAMQYDLMRAANGTEYVSFMRGVDIDNYNYLSTDYSNIHFNEIKKRNIVEGLQIENISISMANYTCPHVTIKFIDIRGGGFFGREEATHNEYGKLKDLEIDTDGRLIDNIFGGFVSFPYPRFKLQIKGFYGKDVTYQLTCSGFSGNFNSSTGNFEITTQFIGYEYGVLGDIPFDYIVAAPLTERGGAYWDRQVQLAQTNNSNDWMLHFANGSKSEPPFRLFDFYERVKSAIEEFGDKDDGMDLIVDEALGVALSDYNDINDKLTLIRSYLNSFKETLRNTYGAEYITSVSNNDTELMMIHTQGPTTTITNEIATGYNALSNAIEDFANEHPGIGVTSHLIPNCPDDGYWGEWHSGTVKTSNFCEFRTNSEDIGSNIITASGEFGNVSGKIISDKNSCNNVRILYYNNTEEMTIPPALSEQLSINFKNREWCLKGSNYARYAAVIDFNGATAKIDEILTEIKIKEKEYQESISDSSHKTIRDIVGFTPYIGSYFKVVMCHLETFIAMFNETADDIYQEMEIGIRKPSSLGIVNLDTDTDVPSHSTNQVPPFPAVYRRYTTESEAIEELQKPDTKDVKFDAWVGDFQGETAWQEQTIVEELYLALQRIRIARSKDEDNKSSHHTSNEIANFSLVPKDLRRNVPLYVYTSKENLALYTALRAEAIFSQLNHGEKVPDDVAAKFGAIDAYNFVHQTPSIGRLLQITAVSSEGEGLADELLGISKLKNTGRSDTYSFEVAKITNGRQPVFVTSSENSEKLSYVYMQNNDGGVIVPMNEYKDFSSNSIKNDYTWENTKFKVTDVHDNAYMFNQNVNDFLTANGNNNDDKSEYTNTQMFNLDGGNTKNSLVNSALFEQYDKIINGDITIGKLDKDKLKNLINEYWLIDTHCLSFYNNSKKSSYKSYDDVFSTNSKNKICSGATIPAELQNINTKEKTDKFIKDFKSKIIL